MSAVKPGDCIQTTRLTGWCILAAQLGSEGLVTEITKKVKLIIVLFYIVSALSLKVHVLSFPLFN